MIREREAVIQEARTWLNTKFHHAAAVKDAGVDCVHLPAAVWSKVYGINIDPVAAYKEVTGEKEAYTIEWHLHRDELEFVYLDGLFSQGFVEINAAGPTKWSLGNSWQCKIEPADLVVAKIGRAFSHSGIIVSWPDEVIQAESPLYGRGKVVTATADANWWLQGRELKFFSWKAWHVSNL